MSLPPALAALADYPQWVTYRLVPKPNGKTDKLPCHWATGEISNAHDPAIRTSYDTALAHADLAARGGHGSGVGFVLTADDPFWFLDIDNCAVGGDWSPLAKGLCQRLAGAAVEVSQSGKGLHIIGSGPVPSHGCKNIALGLEFYSELRFIAITGNAGEGGDCRAVVDVAPVIAQYFPANAARSASEPAEWTYGPVEAWNGPTDDAELIRLACATKPKISAANALRPNSAPDSVSFGALWLRDEAILGAAWPPNNAYDTYDASSADLSLASRLAFWTGKDCERIERLMRESPLARAKYDQHASYLRGTILMAVTGCERVYGDQPKAPPPPDDTIKHVTAIPTRSGEKRDIALSDKDVLDKANMQAAEFWFHAAGYSASYDEFRDSVLLNEAPITDNTERAAWCRVRELSTVKFSKDLFMETLRDIAYRNRFHPLREWLDALAWDGQPRLDAWLPTYLGVENSEYSRAIGAIFLTAAVRRARKPGTKFDEIIVLEGPQGVEKSTAVSLLCPTNDWFCDDFNVAMDSRELLEVTNGKWIVEAPELSKMNSSDAERVKHMLSRRYDRARKAYDRNVTERGRQWVAFGTTNADQYLSDPSGNRRIWPAKVGTINLAAIERDREQLWAEACVREQAGASIRLDKSLWAVAAEHQEARVKVDPFQEVLEPLLSAYPNGSIPCEDMWHVLGIPVERRPAMSGRLGDTMKRLGWRRGRGYITKNNRPYVYRHGSGVMEIFWDITSRQFITERPKLAVI